MTDSSAAMDLQGLFHGQVEADGPCCVRLTAPLKLTTPAYLADRDFAEMELHRTIERLRATKP